MDCHQAFFPENTGIRAEFGLTMPNWQLFPTDRREPPKPRAREKGRLSLSDSCRRNQYMAICAAAFHESISVAKLEELFRSDLNKMFSGTMACECPKCHARFALFFRNAEDPDNGKYLE